MAKKAPAKPAAKRKPRAKNRVDIAGEKLTKELAKPIAWRSWLVGGAKAAAWIVCGAVAGVYAAGGIEVGPGSSPQRSDVLAKAYDADRVTQIAVLRDLAKQPFDGSTADGKISAQDWFNVQRFRNRPKDYGPYTEAVAEAIDANSEEALANKLEGK
jgi:hypothetical protein